MEYSDKCWKAVCDEGAATTWQGARFACGNDEADLATINSEEEQNFVRSTYPGRLIVQIFPEIKRVKLVDKAKMRVKVYEKKPCQLSLVYGGPTTVSRK